MKSKAILLTAFAAALAMGVPGVAKTPAKTAAAQTTAATTTAAPSATEIADAKAKGLVWVNTRSKVYHKDGASYGATKAGKFMTEDEAKSAGYHAAKDAQPKRPKPVTSTAKSTK